MEIGNEERAERLIEKYGFDFGGISKSEIIGLIEKELMGLHEGSSEYIRVLCGYLYCIGDASDVPLLKQVKYGISFDVGCVIDGEWIEALEKNDTKSREDGIRDFVSYYTHYFGIENK